MASATTRGGRAVRWRAVCRRGRRVPGARRDGWPVPTAVASAMVLPQSLLGTRRGRHPRRCRCAGRRCGWVWWSPTPMFDASVRTWALRVGAWRHAHRRAVVRTGVRAVGSVPAPCGASWSSLLVAKHGRPVRRSPGRIQADGPVLGDIAAFTVDFRDQYYGLVAAVGDDLDGPPLVTSGLIEPGAACGASARCASRSSGSTAAGAARSAVAEDAAMGRAAAGAEDPDRQPDGGGRGGDRSRRGVAAQRAGATCTRPTRPGDARAPSPAATDWVHHHAAGSGLSPTTVRLTPASSPPSPSPDTRRPSRRAALPAGRPAHPLQLWQSGATQQPRTATEPGRAGGISRTDQPMTRAACSARKRSAAASSRAAAGYTIRRCTPASM